MTQWGTKSDTDPYLSYGQCVGQEIGVVLVSVGLTKPGQGEGEAGGDQEHRVHHRQPDHQSEAEGYQQGSLGTRIRYL